jgi:hypothetical protein
MKTFITKFYDIESMAEVNGPRILAPDIKSATKHLQVLDENYPGLRIEGELLEILGEGKEGKQLLHD